MGEHDVLKTKLKNLKCAIDIEFYPIGHTATQKKYLLVYPTGMDFKSVLHFLQVFRTPTVNLFFLNQEMFEDLNIIEQLGEPNEF
ncbi:MAG: hypothetical protein ACRC90_05145, partial [Lactococcus garvieae]